MRYRHLAISPIPGGGNLQFPIQEILALQQSIKDILFAEPFPAEVQPNVSATEMAIRQQNWTRRNGASAGRLTDELLRSIITIGLKILENKGSIEKLNIDGEEVEIQYESPLLDLQNQEDVQRAFQWVQSLQATFGEAFLLAMEAGKYPSWLADKMNVDLDIVRDTEDTQGDFDLIRQQIEDNLAKQATPEVPVPTPGQLPSIESFAQ